MGNSWPTATGTSVKKFKFFLWYFFQKIFPIPYMLKVTICVPCSETQRSKGLLQLNGFLIKIKLLCYSSVERVCKYDFGLFCKQILLERALFVLVLMTMHISLAFIGEHIFGWSFAWGHDTNICLS